MKVVLKQRVAPGTCGLLSIRHNDIAVDLPVCVTHSESDCDGLRFHFASHADRNAIARLVACFSDSSSRDCPAIVL